MSTYTEQARAEILGQVVAINKESGTMAYVATIRAQDNHDYIIVASGHYQGGINMLHAAGCKECAKCRQA